MLVILLIVYSLTHLKLENIVKESRLTFIAYVHPYPNIPS